MIRGTTPTIKLKFPFEVASITQIRVYFMQGSQTVLVKDEESCVFEDDTVSIPLSEEETFEFSAKKRCEIKCRFATGGVVGGMISKFIDVYDTGSNERFDPIPPTPPTPPTPPYEPVYYALPADTAIYTLILEVAPVRHWVYTSKPTRLVIIDDAVTGYTRFYSVSTEPFILMMVYSTSSVAPEISYEEDPEGDPPTWEYEPNARVVGGTTYYVFSAGTPSDGIAELNPSIPVVEDSATDKHAIHYTYGVETD